MLDSPPNSRLPDARIVALRLSLRGNNATRLSLLAPAETWHFPRRAGTYLPLVESKLSDVCYVRRPNPGFLDVAGACFEDTGAVVQDTVCVGSVVPNTVVGVQTAGVYRMVSPSLI